MHSSRMHTARSSSRMLGGGCLPQCMLGYPPGVCLEIPQVFAWRPTLGVGDPAQARPLNFHPGCGPGDLQGMLDYNPPSVNRMTDTCKNITFANFVCGRLN